MLGEFEAAADRHQASRDARIRHQAQREVMEALAAVVEAAGGRVEVPRRTLDRPHAERLLVNYFDDSIVFRLREGPVECPTCKSPDPAVQRCLDGWHEA
jgi:hypothetical protein